jgi:SAM-dependent methyltransferase
MKRKDLTKIPLSMPAAKSSRTHDSLEPGRLSFRCNICDWLGWTRIETLDREGPSCERCKSSVRLRAIIHILSIELFGRSLSISEFPDRPDIVGLGISDWEVYAAGLQRKFNYTNTYYHQEPKLDLRAIDRKLEGTMDFVIATDVFEHIAPPISTAFESVRRILKPNGVFVFSVPYAKEGEETIEHFAQLHNYEVLEREGNHILRNVTEDGVEQIFDRLVFHGGIGSTLEMRLFSESSLMREFQQAGFGRIKIYKEPDFDHGIFWQLDWSLPLSARV